MGWLARLLSTRSWANRAQDEAGAAAQQGGAAQVGLMVEAQLKSSSHGKGLWPSLCRQGREGDRGKGGGQAGQAAAALPALAPSPGTPGSRTDPLRALAYALQSLNL